MENASKALIMAGGVLIGVLLLSVMVYLFNSAGSMAQTYDQSQSQRRLEYFNSKFLGYNKVINGTSRGNNVSEVVSAVNLAFDYNNSFTSFNGDYDTIQRCLIVICDAHGNVKYQLPNNYKQKNRILDVSANKDITLNDFMRLYVTSDGSFTQDSSGTKISEMKIAKVPYGDYVGVEEYDYQIKENPEVVYKYGFETTMHINDYTKRVDAMAFILVPMDGNKHTIKINGSVNPKDYGLASEYEVSTFNFDEI